jgi:hypothetical protein
MCQLTKNSNIFNLKIVPKLSQKRDLIRNPEENLSRFPEKVPDSEIGSATLNYTS